MKLEKKHYYWIGAAALATVIGVVIYKKSKNKKAEKALLTSETTSKPSTTKEYEEETKEEKPLFPLQLGSNNKEVKSVQKYMNSTCPSDLKKEGVYPLLLDGVWGNNTEAASLACSVLKRNKIDNGSFKIILRDLASANISV